MDKEKVKITNSTQFEKLVEEMEKNTALAKGFRRGTVPNNFKELWESISTVLNAFGPPRRSGDGWQKVWRDLKFKVKRKLTKNKAECTTTGGGIFTQLTLSPLDETVANLVQFQRQINPRGAFQGVQCEGQNSPRELQQIMEENVDTIDLDLSNVQKSPENVRRQLAPATTSVLNENSTPLQRSQSYSTKPLLKRSLRDANKFHKELLHIEEKKLKLAEEKSEREKEMHETELKIKRIKLCTKEKELQILNSQIQQ
ncbi:uncharacterized protein LOC135950526 [Calliphora vicina]|uniref:uncharacterized protein LOC135950526 n=1 Tax=Calliphora vicina TaxID=7373 RepID=UPI00325B340D